MASPTVRGGTAAAAGLSTTSPSSTEVGDLVIVITWERLGAGSANTLSINTGFVELDKHFHNDGTTDGEQGIAARVAHQAGAQTYQGFTSSVGTNVWTGCLVITKDTYGLDLFLRSGTANNDSRCISTTATGTGAPNPPLLTLDTSRDWLVLAIGAWHLSASATVTITAPTNYTEQWEMAGSNLGELSVATRALTAPASEDPGAFTDDVTPNGSVATTLGIPSPLAAENGWTLRQVRAQDSPASGGDQVARVFAPLGNSLICAYFRSDGAVTHTAITDGDSNSYTKRADIAQAERVSIWSAIASAGDTCIDVTFDQSANSVNRTYVFAEFTGNSPATFEGSNTKANASETTVESNTVTPTANGCLFFGALSPNSSSIIVTPSAGWYELAEMGAGAQAQFDTQTTAAAKESIWTLDVADDATCAVAVFAPAAVAVDIGGIPNIIYRVRKGYW